MSKFGGFVLHLNVGYVQFGVMNNSSDLADFCTHELHCDLNLKINMEITVFNNVSETTQITVN